MLYFQIVVSDRYIQTDSHDQHIALLNKHKALALTVILIRDWQYNIKWNERIIRKMYSNKHKI